MAKAVQERLRELVSQHGQDFKKIAAVMKREGYRDAFTEKVLTVKVLQKRWEGMEQAEGSKPSEKPERSKRRRVQPKVNISEPSEPVAEPESLEPSEDSERLKSSEARELGVEELAAAVLQTLLENGELARAVQGIERAEGETIALEICPQPERTRNRKYRKLGGTVDTELFKIFHEKRRELGLSTSVMLETCLWNALGKPVLSFQKVQNDI